jgi:hypothetical protein
VVGVAGDIKTNLRFTIFATFSWLPVILVKVELLASTLENAMVWMARCETRFGNNGGIDMFVRLRDVSAKGQYSSVDNRGHNLGGSSYAIVVFSRCSNLTTYLVPACLTGIQKLALRSLATAVHGELLLSTWGNLQSIE